MQCTYCGSSDIHVENSQAICASCGSVLEESQIVSDVTFGENSAGGAIVQGSFVGADQTSIRSSNPRFRSGGAGESREHTMLRAREAIERMGRANRITTHVRERALRWFNLALDGGTANMRNHDGQPKNYVLGRKQEYTVASCLYVACRMEKTTHMLIDFADSMNVNVFTLGRHYLKLVQALNLHLPVLDPSIYIMRFAALLHFGDETHKVAADASRLCRRFKKDWLADGRRPAGICGACLLLAARMNNFRRSMNEIVQVVKMADVTIRERLEEFKRTPSGKLTVQDFKSVWLEEEHEPPAFYRPQIEEEKKRAKEERLKAREAKRAASRKARKRTKREDDEGGAVESDADDSQNSDNDADREDEGGKRAPPPVVPQLPPELDALADQATRDEINQYVQDADYEQLARQVEDSNLAAQERARRGTRAMTEAPALGENYDAQAGPSSPSSAVKISDSQQPRLSQLPHAGAGEGEGEDGTAAATAAADAAARAVKQGSQAPDASASAQPIDTLSDLDSDELDQFILGEEEVRIKERVWMEFNQDYLQEALQRRLKEEADEKAGIKRKPNRRRGGAGGPGGGNARTVRDSSNARGDSAMESTKAMLQKKKFSKKINYDALNGLFPAVQSLGGASSSSSRLASQKKRARDDAHSRRAKARSHRDAGGTSGEESTDNETREARARLYFGEGGLAQMDDDAGMSTGMEVIEEAGDALPSNHPIARKASRAEAKMRASRTGTGRTTDGDTEGEGEGEDASAHAHDIGVPLPSGEDEGDEDAEGEEDDDAAGGQFGLGSSMYARNNEAEEYWGEA